MDRGCCVNFLRNFLKKRFAFMKKINYINYRLFCPLTFRIEAAPHAIDIIYAVWQYFGALCGCDRRSQMAFLLPLAPATPDGKGAKFFFYCGGFFLFFVFLRLFCFCFFLEYK